MASCKIGELNVIDTVAGKRWGCHIKLHRLSCFASDSKLMLSWDNYPFNLFMKWRWYFRYRAALIQVQYPRQAVEIIEFQWQLSEEETAKISIKNKYVKAKADLTKFQNRLQAAKDKWNLLFPIEDDITYKKALERIELQKSKIQELENMQSLFSIT